jgi:DNA processing protein
VKHFDVNCKMLKPIPEPFMQLPQLPMALYYAGPDFDELLARPRVAVVGSRRPTAYGQQVTLKLVEGLVRSGVVIVSGLALGIDALAHKTAIEHRGTALAVLPGPLNNIVPKRNYALSHAILEKGGGLLSEYPSSSPIYQLNFIARNRLIAAASQAVIIPEAASDSGSLHTAAFALELGKEVFAVPGEITSPLSAGTNNLLKSGASLVTSVADILHALQLDAKQLTLTPVGDTPEEQTLLNLLIEGVRHADSLLERSGLAADKFARTLTKLEICGKIRSLGGNQWTTA